MDLARPPVVLLASLLGSLVAAAAWAGPVDSDFDGVPDGEDNCPFDSNPLQENDDNDNWGDACDNCLGVDNTLGGVPVDQCDTDADGYGNACDGDFNEDLVVGVPDFNIFRACFGNPAAPGFAECDCNCDGTVGLPDFNCFRQQFGNGPGPSGDSIELPPPPDITITSPTANQEFCTDSSIGASGTVTAGSTVTVNGMAANVTGTSWSVSGIALSGTAPKLLTATATKGLLSAMASVSVQPVKVEFSPSPLDLVCVGSAADLTATLTPASASSVTFVSQNTGIATVSGAAPNLSVAVGSPSGTAIDARIDSVVCASVAVSGLSNPAFNAAAFVANDGAAASMALGACDYGFTYPENVAVPISACREGSNWCAIATGMTGNYSLQARLLPGQVEVTGPGGNTTMANFCAQATELDQLGGCPGAWYMLQAVIDHEEVHATRFQPGGVNAAPAIEVDIEAVCAAGGTQAQGIAAIQGSAGFAAAQTSAQTDWLNEILVLVANDHNPGGPTDTAEHAVVDAMVASICTHAHAPAQNWDPGKACAVCAPFAP